MMCVHTHTKYGRQIYMLDTFIYTGKSFQLKLISTGARCARALLYLFTTCTHVCLRRAQSRFQSLLLLTAHAR